MTLNAHSWLRLYELLLVDRFINVVYVVTLYQTSLRQAYNCFYRSSKAVNSGLGWAVWLINIDHIYDNQTWVNYKCNCNSIVNNYILFMYNNCNCKCQTAVTSNCNCTCTYQTAITSNCNWHDNCNFYYWYLAITNLFRVKIVHNNILLFLNLPLFTSFHFHFTSCSFHFTVHFISSIRLVTTVTSQPDRADLSLTMR